MWLSWLGFVQQSEVTDSIPGQGTCLGGGFGPQLGYIREATD